MESFAIVDIETTGGAPKNSGITELGIVQWSLGGEAVAYQKLVKPKYSIPFNIEKLTGISNEMIADAPPFDVVAPEVLELLEGRIFVAHNVHFDFGFIRYAFEQLNQKFNPSLLCTRRYAKALFPELKSYSLANLTRYFNYVNPNPHRALADAEAAAFILQKCLERDEDRTVLKHLLKKKSASYFLPVYITREEIDELPDEPGVYTFKDKHNQPVYIGKAKNLKKRVLSHFTGSDDSYKDQRFKREIRSLSHLETATVEMAGIVEDSLIKKHWPKFNRAQKEPVFLYRIVHYLGRDSAMRLTIQKRKRSEDAIATFYSNSSAKQWLQLKVDEYQLNPIYCDAPIFANSGITVEAHNAQCLKLIKDTKEQESNYLLLVQGNTKKGVLHVEKGRVIGYSIYGVQEQLEMNALLESIQPIHTSRIIEKIKEDILMYGLYEEQIEI